MAADADANIDPQLGDSQAQPPQPQGLPSRPLENAEDDSDDEDGASEKRRKLNLWKCRQCREARKKCLPEGRVWPQKCDRCLQHRPDALDCSEPELNNRKRGKNVVRRSKARSTPDIQEPRRNVRDLHRDEVGDGDESLPDAPLLVIDRPGPQPVLPRGIKRELPGSPKPVIEPQQPTSVKEDFPPSVYLPLKDGEFRVLLLAPAARLADPVVFSFVTVSRSEPLEYEAVSYLWGGNDLQQDMKDVELRDPQQRRYFKSTKRTLYLALQNLRHNKHPRPFWVDALCINRNDVVEKNRQIAMKRYIFHKATNLCFWLGDDASSKVALDFVEQVLDLTGVGKLVRDNAAVEQWVAFVTLLKNPVFSRLWLVQEVAVARKATLHCGQTAKYFGDLVEAVSTFVSLRAEITLLFRRNQKNCKILTDRKMTIAERFIDISTNALRVSSTGKVQRLLSLEGLVSQLSDLSSGSPLDRIYAVLALAKDGPTLVNETLMEYPKDTPDNGALRIDYDKSIREVYQDFVIHAIEKSKSLDIICRHWASSVSEKDARLPTWVRPLQSFLQPPFENSPDRTAADSLVGLPDHTYYHASRGTLAKFRVVPWAPNDEGDSVRTMFDEQDRYPGEAKSLIVRGRYIDTISKLGPRASEGIILYEWLELGGCTAGGETVPENFWRTLVADRGPNGSNVPSWYRRAFLYCLTHLTPTGDINTNRLIAESEMDESSLVVDFLQRIQSVIWNRKFLVSKSNNWLGLAPMAAQPEDLICILYGCSVPVVLRPTETIYGDRYYQLVGECYVHGMMDGEAVETAMDDGVDFELK
ncbi:Heterokaryon incompatibility protein [Hyphodiscus hymeniophilus]|uniref:Heterokaryon incompatibility protein n=1 Tax=Hyphodiscus hymeniophilus TaxID=353542 RepID=A0A9P6VLZ3_9HELO|nr:Heterokaryon incompatibility protein [Hyphodiscus hymeniophilus]